ncbi:hypothetical protein AOCH_006939 [Aspergillus ochraceoroseus]|uniref:Anaphase-promoting complex subunit 2 n=1 Tax=Aspergillus ochraceoroseus TaxID=138278 RepID=A0A0F8V4L7_9EURO|nr:hypothetical protein AOCH_006939 [Aspergillus ochraceoroseus]
MGSFMEELWSSIFTPGPTPTLLIATNVTFAALQVLLLALLIATYSIHFVVLSVLSGSLWYSINWFAQEVKAAQAASTQKPTQLQKPSTDGDDNKNREVTGSDRKLRKSGSPDGAESDTETEGLVERKSAPAARPSLQSASTTASTTLQLPGAGDTRKRPSVGGDSSGYTSTDIFTYRTRQDQSILPSIHPSFLHSQVSKESASSSRNASQITTPRNMAPDSSICAGRSHIFASVFPPASVEDCTSTTARRSPPPPPPPPTTTTTGSGPSSQSSRKSNTVSHGASEPVTRSGKKGSFDRAWRSATGFLALPDRGFEPLVRFEEIGEAGFLELWNRHKKPSKEVRDALRYLVQVSLASSGSGSHAERRSIVDWYGSEIQRHFLGNFRAGLCKLLDSPSKDDLLHMIVDCLQLVRRIYFVPLVEYLLPLIEGEEQGKVFLRLRRSFHMMIGYALPWTQISMLLMRELMKDALVILGIDSLSEEVDIAEDVSVDNMEVDRQYSVSYHDWRDAPSAEIRAQLMTEVEDLRVNAARERLLSLLSNLQLVGMGGEKAQEVFASVMDTMMTEFIRAAYTSHWEGPSLVSLHLRQWIENVFAQLVVQVLAVINVSESGVRDQGYLDVKLSDVQKWQDIGIARLGALRTGELFDVIIEWPASSGAIEDLRHFTTHPASRHHLTHSFAAVLNRRLLHPGASTVEILQVYISIIRAFNLLDPKGVLLDRIARPIRRYLRDREDTIKVIVGGLLADPANADGRTASSSETLVELSAELNKAHQTSMRNDSGELDWDDMNWMPDPVDAAPDYRKSKSSDVIGSLISLFDSKETFVREMQNMLAERLLQKRTDFDQEMSVLELLKLRFGDSALQACEVMLRDIFDSRRVDAVVRNDQGMIGKRRVQQPFTPDGSGMDDSRASAVETTDMPELHAKILSHFFWPEIQGQEFKVPEEIAQLQQRYAEGFGSLKQSRKLTWLNGLGQVIVELDLEDRVFVEEVTTWQATVIYAFNNPSSSSEAIVTKTTSELSQELQMSTALVRSACLFWVSRRILAEVQRDIFRVLETLPVKDSNNQGTATTPAGATAGTSGGASGVDDTMPDGGRSGTTDAETAAAAANAAAAAAAKESADAAAMEKMNLYWQFIVGMLTNQGAMPLQRIVMMLKIAVPGGFPFSNEELREFLAGMVSKGKLEIVSGGNYKIVQ